MDNEEVDFAEVLAPILDHNQPLLLGHLKVLSDLDDDQESLFRHEWPDVEPSHRRSLAQNMQELSAESLDLDFRSAFTIMLDDEDPQVRIAAVRGLNEDSRHSTLRHLLEMLQSDPDEGVRSEVATTLGIWALQAVDNELDQRSADKLLATLQDVFNQPKTPVVVRQRLLETLGYWDDDAIFEYINTALRNPDPTWQQAALCAMGHSGMEDWLPTIKQFLNHESPALRFEAVRAAGEIGEDAQPLVNSIARMVADDDIEVATTTMWALGQIGGPSARRLLEQLARDAEGAKREAAAEALHELQFFADPLHTLPLDDDDEDEYWYGEDAERN